MFEWTRFQLVTIDWVPQKANRSAWVQKSGTTQRSLKPTNTLMKKLEQQQSRRKAYLTSPLVVVDEVGYLPIDTHEAYLFFQFVSYRYERSSTLITSNKSFGDWQELFGGQVIATAILDRLLHFCRVVNIKGHSYRLRGYSFSKNDFASAGAATQVA